MTHHAGCRAFCYACREPISGTGALKMDASFFGIGMGELVMIAVVALVVLGPKRLPGVLRELAKTIRYVRNLSNELMAQYGEEFKALDDVNPQKILRELTQVLESDAANPSAANPSTATRTPTASKPASPKPASPKPTAPKPAQPRPAPKPASASSPQPAVPPPPPQTPEPTPVATDALTVTAPVAETVA
jgi:sec-independent protein translocase protein TatB